MVDTRNAYVYIQKSTELSPYVSCAIHEYITLRCACHFLVGHIGCEHVKHKIRIVMKIYSGTTKLALTLLLLVRQIW